MKRDAYWNGFLMLLIVVVLVCLTSLGSAGGPLSTREKGAGIGALGGALVQPLAIRVLGLP